jgi:hypothetical protein
MRLLILALQYMKHQKFCKMFDIFHVTSKSEISGTDVSV